jgi:WD40 repeat protein
MQIWDPKTKKRVGTINNAGAYIDALAFGPDGLLYGIGRGTPHMQIWDPKTKKRVGTINKAGAYISALAFKTKSTGQESLVTINLTLRSRNEYDKDRQFQKKDYLGGNFKINKTDKYMRDTFSSKVLVRNLVL